MANRLSAGFGDAAFNLADSASEFRLVSEAPKFLYQPPKAIEDYQKKFDPVKLPPSRPTRTVVVAQDPPAGQVVPPGTEVKVTLLPKGVLPVGGFQVSEAFKNKYGNGTVELILKDLDEKGQAVTPILQSEKPYESLSVSEKQAVSNYAAGLGIQAGDEAGTKAFFDDIQFFNNF